MQEEGQKKGWVERILAFFLDPLLDTLSSGDRTVSEVREVGDQLDEGLHRKRYDDVEEYLLDNPESASASGPGLQQVAETTAQLGSAAESARDTLVHGYTAAEHAMISSGAAHIVFKGGRFVLKRKIAIEAGEALASTAGPFKSFTARNFRENLFRLTGEVPEGAQAHHVFPQRFADRFRQLGVDVNDPHYGAWWEASDHLRNAAQYNARWVEFFARPNPSLEQAIQFAQELAGQYGLTLGF